MTLWQQILDRVILWRMKALGNDIDPSWCDEETDMLVRDQLPSHLLGQYDQVRENAIPLVDGLMTVIQGRLR